MVLEYLGRTVAYHQLVQQLGIGPFGAPRRNITRLARPGLQVAYGQATLPILATHLEAGLPVIAFVDTGELAYWTVTSNHAIVVVGITGDTILVNDPAFAVAPQRIACDEFELAWLNCDNACAVIKPAQ
jgi:ABC-type bacteriocin/lantibiotic exporter with double-glycine peptidase domain